MKLLIVALSASAALLLAGCGAVAQRCQSHCDCTRTDAELKCPGEWACVEGTCRYECRSPCEQLPYTCAADQSCNGSICSARQCGM